MARPENTRVLIVDEHPLFCIGLSSLLKLIPGYSVVGEAATIDETLKIAEKERPHLVIMEIHFENENGMELITQLRSRYQEIIILVMSTHDERYYSERILRLGAQGYIMKNAPANIVKEAILTVMRGKVYLSETEKERIFEIMTSESTKGMKDWANSLRKLSDRELQIFSLIGKGYGAIEIASKLNLSTKTVDTHKEHIKIKLHCNTSQGLRQLAIEWLNNLASL
ncbi:MAG: response regulator transcription factor [Treponema sp.]|jgi:DNA-binding NarL/FixJ family response regulator|nr:response regulator transcription factor [Treponema sp.]